MPALLAGLGVERDQVIVGRLHVQVVVPHAEAAIADVRAALGLPEVVPQLAAVARVHRPGVVRHGEVQRAVHLQHRALDGAAAGRDIARTFAADDQVRRRRRRRVRRVRRPPALPAPGVTRVIQASVRFFTLD